MSKASLFPAPQVTLPRRGYRALAAAVLTRALRDCASPAPEDLDPSEVEEARRFLTSHTFWHDLAGVRPFGEADLSGLTVRHIRRLTREYLCSRPREDGVEGADPTADPDLDLLEVL